MSKLFLRPSGKVPTVKGNNLLLLGAKSFPFTEDPLSKGNWYTGIKQKVTKVIFFLQNDGNLT